MIYIEVYNLLSDKEKQKLYDNYGIDCAYDFSRAIAREVHDEEK